MFTAKIREKETKTGETTSSRKISRESITVIHGGSTLGQSK